MPRHRHALTGWILGFLVLANIVNYYYWNWGLITVKVTDAPLSKVIRSIEWQGWVKIYTNLPPDAKVSMYVDHVPLSEAMETLAANVDGRPAGAARPDRPDRPRDGAPGGPGGFGQDRANGGARPGGGGPGQGGPGGGGRGGGFGGGAQWNLAFFVAPTPGEVREEIREFQSGDTDDDTKVYTYPTQLQLVTDGIEAPTADPRLQSWPGYTPPDPSPPPVAAAATDGSAGNGPTAPAPEVLSPAQTYLRAFAESANIWIMAPGSWAPAVSSAPQADSSIIRAVKNFVSRSHGAVTEAIILRVGRGGGNRGRGGGGFAGGDTGWSDRLRNAINGLPAEARPDALAQLTQEIQFRKDLQSLPPDQRRQKMFQHMMEKMLYSDRIFRLSPTKRAQMYQRMVAARNAARGR